MGNFERRSFLHTSETAKEDRVFMKTLRVKFYYLNKNPVEGVGFHAVDNKGEICKTRLVHGFQFRKITPGLNELLKAAPQVFAADYQVCIIYFDCTFRSSYMS